MTRWVPFWLISFGWFVGGIVAQQGVRLVIGHDFNWFAFIWPGIATVSVHWITLAGSAPAPWVTPEQAYRAADKLAASTSPTSNLGG